MLLTFWAGIFKFYRIQIDLNETTNSQRHQATNFVSLGITVVYTRIWGYERAYARSYPQIRTISRQSLKNPNFSFLFWSLDSPRRCRSGGVTWWFSQAQLFAKVYNI
jgi:hypothetical protein